MAASPWTHPLCEMCFIERAGPGRNPARLRPAELETCCACGSLTQSGIYYRAAPGSLEFCDVNHE